jgi:hypothetical protein
MRRVAALALLLSMFFGMGDTARAQGCDPAGLTRFIGDLQSGRVDWYSLSPQLAQTISYQTQGTGRYPQLIALGEPKVVFLISSQPVPYGIVCNYRVEFTSAALNWTLAFGRNIMVAAAFGPADPPIGASTTPPANPPPAPGGGGGTDPPGGSVPAGTVEACRLYPNLC